MDTDIRDNVKVAMKERCFTQSSIATKAHMSPATFSMILGKKRKLDANELYALCEAMEISPTELRDRYKPQNRKEEGLCKQ